MKGRERKFHEELAFSLRLRLKAADDSVKDLASCQNTERSNRHIKQARIKIKGVAFLEVLDELKNPYAAGERESHDPDDRGVQRVSPADFVEMSAHSIHCHQYSADSFPRQFALNPAPLY